MFVLLFLMSRLVVYCVHCLLQLADDKGAQPLVLDLFAPAGMLDRRPVKHQLEVQKVGCRWPAATHPALCCLSF